MKMMGWSYLDLMACPDDYIDVLSEMAREENRVRQQAAAAAKAKARRR